MIRSQRGRRLNCFMVERLRLAEVRLSIKCFGFIRRKRIVQSGDRTSPEAHTSASIFAEATLVNDFDHILSSQ